MPSNASNGDNGKILNKHTLEFQTKHPHINLTLTMRMVRVFYIFFVIC